MATGVLSPSPVFTGWDNNGDPLPGGLLYTYLAGTSTPAATYTDVALTVSNANPVVLDAAGRAVLFLTPAQSYKYVLRTAAGALVWSQDNILAPGSGSSTIDISGVAGEALSAGKVVYLSDGSGGLVAGRWYLTQTANAYSSTLPAIGMTIAAIGGGATGVIRVEGVVTGLSGLTAGTTYTAGDAGTLATGGLRIVGQADTITTLVLAVRNTPTIAITSTSVGTQNNWAPTGFGKVPITHISWQGASDATITGLVAGMEGQIVNIGNEGSGVLRFPHADAGSTAGNQFSLIALSAPTPVAARGWIQLQYRAPYWRVIAHEQGAPITPTYAAANYGGPVAWTVDAGDVTTQTYHLRGRMLTLTWYLGTTSYAGGSNILYLESGVMGGFSPAKTVNLTHVYNDNGTGLAIGPLAVFAATGRIQLYKPSLAAFAASANNTLTSGSITYEVT